MLELVLELVLKMLALGDPTGASAAIIFPLLLALKVTLNFDAASIRFCLLIPPL